MKALMYHYVRPEPVGLDSFVYLHVSDFARQLDWLADHIGFVSRADFERAIETCQPPSGALLTFDDGLADHYDRVLPILRDRGLWGTFYIPTGVYQTGKLLDVHRIHLLLGRFGGAYCMNLIKEIVTDEMMPDRLVEEFRTLTYRYQDNDAATQLFKRTLNYYISYDWREALLDRLIPNALDDETESELTKRFNMTPKQLRLLSEDHIVGSHTVTHPVMSKLSEAEQRREIEDFLPTWLTLPARTWKPSAIPTEASIRSHPRRNGCWRKLGRATVSMLNRAISLQKTCYTRAKHCLVTIAICGRLAKQALAIARGRRLTRIHIRPVLIA